MPLFTPKYQPPPVASSERYAGKPLVVILESYVLNCIERLTPEKETELQSLTQKVYGGGPDWRGTLRTMLQLSDSLDKSLRELWEIHRELAWEARVHLKPEDFARMVVDQNFASLIDAR